MLVIWLGLRRNISMIIVVTIYFAIDAIIYIYAVWIILRKINVFFKGNLEKTVDCEKCFIELKIW